MSCLIALQGTLAAMCSPRVVVLSPHLDDAVLSAWNVLVRPTEVQVVNVCTGAPPPGTPPPRWDRITGADDPVEWMARRVEEDREALALARRDPVNLGFLDSQYRDGELDAGEVAGGVEPLLDGAAELHAPLGLGGHPDHLAVLAAARELARGRGLRLFLYAELPYAVRFGWPHWVTGAAPDPHCRPEVDWERWLGPLDGFGGPEVVRLARGEAEAKLRAMRTYRTQFAAMDGGPAGLLSHPLVAGFEVRYPGGA